MIELGSFDLKIRGSRAAGYTVEAVGPLGEWASAPFAWAPTPDLGARLEDLQVGATNQTAMEGVGKALFEALFPMDVLVVYIAVKAQLGESQGLRLRLHLPSELARLPWELLYYPPFFLCTDPRSPVVRFLDLPGTPRPLQTQPPLRLLHLIASPADTPPLGVEQEASLLGSALADLAARGMAEIIPGRPGTLAMLRNGLRQGCHIMHFSGHGGLAGGEGYLVFEDDGGRARRVDADTLAHLLRGTSVRLAVLNACESATATDADAFGSVAAALVQAGLPAVIAHQHAMPDSSAIPFAAEFYRSLAEGFPVDGAVAEGRKAIISELGSVWRERVDWATPVLFMRAADGRILDLEETKERIAATDQPAAPVVQQEVTAMGDAATIGTVSGGLVNIDFGGSPLTVPMPALPPLPDPLPGLLAELRQTVRDHTPEEMRDQALERVATLRDAATGDQPDLAVMEAVLRWFEAKVPAISGAVLSAIQGTEQRAEKAGDDVLLEFRRRFGTFS